MVEEKTEMKFGQTVSDVLTFELTKPVITRLRDRLKQLQEDSQAKNLPRQVGTVRLWKTIPPKIFINNLQATMQNGLGIITYSIYKKDGDNKFVKVTTAKKKLLNGEEVEVELAKEYVLEKFIVETIEQYKPIVTKTVRPEVD